MDFLQWCADGRDDFLSYFLADTGWEKVWLDCQFEEGFGSRSQSLLEQGIEVSLAHNNSVWERLIGLMAPHPEHLKRFVLGQLLYWDMIVYLNPGVFSDKQDVLMRVFARAVESLDASHLTHLEYSVYRSCLPWGKSTFDRLRAGVDRKNLVAMLEDTQIQCKGGWDDGSARKI